MVIKRVQISQIINKPISKVFEWFYYSENFTASPIVFKSNWSKGMWDKNSERDIVMIAGWYHEEITAVKKNDFIQYRVQKSFPKVKQDLTEIKFIPTQDGTKVIWTIEVGMPTQLLANVASKMAKTLYATIMTAAKRKLEK